MGIQAPEPPGHVVARLRYAQGLSVDELAKLAGVSRASVYRAELGHAMKRDVVAGLAGVLGSEVWEAMPPWPPIPRHDTVLSGIRSRSRESQRQMAERVGVSTGVFARAERGARIHPRHAKAIADAYGLDVADVLPVPQRKSPNTRQAA